MRYDRISRDHVVESSDHVSQNHVAMQYICALSISVYAVAFSLQGCAYTSRPCQILIGHIGILITSLPDPPVCMFEATRRENSIYLPNMSPQCDHVNPDSLFTRYHAPARRFVSKGRSAEHVSPFNKKEKRQTRPPQQKIVASQLPTTATLALPALQFHAS